MKIKTITFGRLKSFGTFENIRIEASAEVKSNPEETLKELQNWVDDKVAEEISTPRVEWMSKQVKDLHTEIRTLTEQRDKLNEEIYKKRDVLGKLGTLLDSFMTKEETSRGE